MIVRPVADPEETLFYTPPNYDMQVGRVVHSAADDVAPHFHPQRSRVVDQTSELLVVERGALILNLYNLDKKLLCSRRLSVGTIILLMACGHGFEFVEDTCLLEVKLGPYARDQDKRFL